MVFGRGDILNMAIGTWKVKAYMEYEIEAENEEEAIQRMGECIFSDLDDGNDIRDIAEINAEKISDIGLVDSE
jgi:hypothetical protein